MIGGCAHVRAKDVKPAQPYDFAGLAKMARYAEAVNKDGAAIQALCRPSFGEVTIRLLSATDNQYFIATDTTTRTQLISIRGTNNLRNIVTDADFESADFPQLHIPLHRGFAQAAHSVY